MEKNKDRVFRDALVQIIENQEKIKNHLGISRSYDDNYYDHRIVEELNGLHFEEETMY